MLPQAAREFYGLQQRVNQTAANEVGRIWRRMGDDLDASWRRLNPVALAVLVEAQTVVTDAARRYVPAVLAETGLRDIPSGEPAPGALVGIASDGRRLDTLTYGAVAATKSAVADGLDERAALARGADWLDLMVKLQVADAARQMVGLMTASRKNLQGTVRVLNPPSCQRCAILAGRVYRWSTGFDRHPRCDCVNLPVQQTEWARAEGFITDPMDAYRAGHIRDLAEAQKFAIENGADIATVVNAYRGMSTTATARPLAKRQARGGPTPPVVAPGMPDLLAGVRAKFPKPTGPAEYPTPEGLYQLAKGDREEAIRLLREWGYLT